MLHNEKYYLNLQPITQRNLSRSGRLIQAQGEKRSKSEEYSIIFQRNIFLIKHVHFHIVKMSVHFFVQHKKGSYLVF